MKTSLLCLVILVCSWPATAAACDTIANATLKSTCVVLDREGVRGVWFALETANNLRKATLLVPELKIQLKEHESKASIRKFQLDGYRGAFKLKERVTAQQQKAVALLTKQERQAREALDAWYRSPSLWFAVGVVVAGVVFGVAVGLRDQGSRGT